MMNAPLRQQQCERLLARYRIAPAELLVLETVGSGPLPLAGAAGAAARTSRHDPLGPFDPSRCEEALSACLNRGWLRVIDDDAIEEIEYLVEGRRLIGPVYGYPRPGDVDFTPQGADVFLRLGEDLYGPDWGTETVYEVRKPAESRLKVYCRTLRIATKVMYDYEHRYDVIAVGDPRPIGPWCVYWWDEYPAGFRINVELAPP
jgi:hypothetical protein